MSQQLADRGMHATFQSVNKDLSVVFVHNLLLPHILLSVLHPVGGPVQVAPSLQHAPSLQYEPSEHQLPV